MVQLLQIKFIFCSCASRIDKTVSIKVHDKSEFSRVTPTNIVKFFFLCFTPSYHITMVQ